MQGEWRRPELRWTPDAVESYGVPTDGGGVPATESENALDDQDQLEMAAQTILHGPATIE
jgi:hypothetical protein